MNTRESIFLVEMGDKKKSFINPDKCSPEEVIKQLPVRKVNVVHNEINVYFGLLSFSAQFELS